MENIKVGIDFGTSQTKICSRNIVGSEIQYIFHKFSKNNQYILPSTITVGENGKCDFGMNNGNPIRYFKMKALFADNIDYRVDAVDPVTPFLLEHHPEICCILYLCYCILDIKKSFIAEDTTVLKNNEKPSSTNGLITTLSRFFKGKATPSIKKDLPKVVVSNRKTEYNFHFTIGIPTRYDWSKEEHKRRSLQFEMLYLALELSNSYDNLFLFLEDNIEGYRSKIKIEYSKLLSVHSKKLLNFYLKKNIYVIAETTAGIFVLQNELERTLLTLEGNPRAQELFIQANLGNYITMDVGAGTTDISFFKLRFAENKVNLVYYASQAIDYASNFIIKNYLKLKEGVENITEDQIASFDFKIDETIWNKALGDARSYLFGKIRAEILPDLLYRFKNSFRENWHYEEGVSKARGCKVYGGGSRLNAFSKGQLVLNHQGNPGINLQVTTEISQLIINEEYLTNIELRNANGKPLTKIEKSDILPRLHLLNTSLGLSLVDFINNPNKQQIEKNHTQVNELSPELIDPYGIGPSNDEGMARFDIFNRDWI